MSRDLLWLVVAPAEEVQATSGALMTKATLAVARLRLLHRYSGLLLLLKADQAVDQHARNELRLLRVTADVREKLLHGLQVPQGLLILFHLLVRIVLLVRLRYLLLAEVVQLMCQVLVQLGVA